MSGEMMDAGWEGPLSPAFVRETMERFLREQGWTHDGTKREASWHGRGRHYLTLGEAVDVALRRVET